MPPAAAASASTKPPPTPALVKETANWEKSLCALVEDKAQFASQAPLLTSTAARLNAAWTACTVSQWQLFDYTMHAFQNNTTPDRKTLQGIVARWNNREFPTEVSPSAAVPTRVTKAKASAAANAKAPTATEAGRKAGSTKKAAATKEANASVEAKKKKVVKSAPTVKSDSEDKPVPPPKSSAQKARTSGAAKSTAEGKSSGKSKAAPPPELSEEGNSDDDTYIDGGEKLEEETLPLRQARARAAGTTLAKMSKKHAPKVTTWTEANDGCTNCKKVNRKCMVAEDLTERQGTACQACKSKKQRCPFAKLNTMGLETPLPVTLFARFDEDVDLLGAEEVEEGSLMNVGELLTGIYLTSRLIRDQNWALQDTVEALQEKVDALEQTIDANHKDALAARPSQPASHSPPVAHVASTETGAQETAPQSAQPVRQLTAAPATAESSLAAPAPPPPISSLAPNKGASPPLVPALEDHGATASALADSQATAPPGAPSPTDSSTTQADTSTRPLPDIGDIARPVAGSSKRKASRVSVDPLPPLTPAKRKEGPEESDHNEEEEGTPQPPVLKKARNGKGNARTRSTTAKAK
ncbi:hypothetical protein GALMADRAFT_210760 [Galerina marginata CBS 339.88]|uniref:Zn(2)-C6 fungal-type domain-containing protein n=1 Tax=Galerina marginata (strain CBS 339.88) TaxID=685588 RepID=A0A067TAP5_GALM3|nr:hypothetical protein GALMADRAFT_210760 [Galerina marginata CBS 339.88]